MSSPESIPESTLQAPATKPKAKRNISEEERARRSDRMKEISAKRIADIKAKKQPAPVPEVVSEPVAPEPPKVLKLKQPKPESDDDDDDDIVEKIIKRLASKSKKQSKVRAPEPESESEDEDIFKPKKSAAKQPSKTKATPRSKPQARAASPPPPPPAPAAPPKRAVRFF